MPFVSRVGSPAIPPKCSNSLENDTGACTLRKFRQYNKASLRELVPLEIDLLYLLDISLGLSKGCTKYQHIKVCVVSSKFYESVLIWTATVITQLTQGKGIAGL